MSNANDSNGKTTGTVPGQQQANDVMRTVNDKSFDGAEVVKPSEHTSRTNLTAIVLMAVEAMLVGFVGLWLWRQMGPEQFTWLYAVIVFVIAEFGPWIGHDANAKLTLFRA
jgi:hypothetical protein